MKKSRIQFHLFRAKHNYLPVDLLVKTTAVHQVKLFIGLSVIVKACIFATENVCG